MSAGMTMEQLGKLIAHVASYNSPLTCHGGVPVVKYIDPRIDMRYGICFSITFQGYVAAKNFNIVNENRHLKESLYDRCMAYLTNPSTIH